MLLSSELFVLSLLVGSSPHSAVSLTLAPVAAGAEPRKSPLQSGFGSACVAGAFACAPATPAHIQMQRDGETGGAEVWILA